MIFGKSDEQLKKELEENQAELKKLQDALAASQNDTRIQVEARQADADRVQELSDENDSLKKEIERLVNLPQGEERTSEGPMIFEYEDRKYRILCKACRIPGLGRRTALEIMVDTEAQAKLVALKSGVIREVE